MKRFIEDENLFSLAMHLVIWAHHGECKSVSCGSGSLDLRQMPWLVVAWTSVTLYSNVCQV